MRIVACETFGPPAALREVEVGRPAPGGSEVLVRIEATGIGFVDGLMIQGKYQVKPPLPHYPGSEFAGTVEAVGDDVTERPASEYVRAFEDQLAGGIQDKFVLTR